MTDPEAMVFEALARGRLIFPFKDELATLRKEFAAGPLTDAEAERKLALEGAFQTLLVKDKWFHSAMEGGDIDTARHIADEALKVCQELA